MKDRASDRPPTKITEPGKIRRLNLGMGDGYPAEQSERARSIDSYRELAPSNLISSSRESAFGLNTLSKRINRTTESSPYNSKKGRGGLQAINDYTNSIIRQNNQTSRREEERRNRQNYDRKNLRLFEDYFEKKQELQDLYESHVEARDKITADLKSPKGDARFPYVLASLALIVDGLDVISGGFAAFITGFIFVIANFIYIRRRMGMTARAAFKFLAKRLHWIIIKFIPVVNFIPESVIMIFLTHNRHKKIVQNMVAAAEILEGRMGKLEIKAK